MSYLGELRPSKWPSKNNFPMRNTLKLFSDVKIHCTIFTEYIDITDSVYPGANTAFFRNDIRGMEHCGIMSWQMLQTHFKSHYVLGCP